MTQHPTTRRAATVSAGTLLLCLSGTGVALAAGATGSAGSAITSPTPAPLPDPGDLVNTVTGVVSQVQAVVTNTPTPAPTTAPTSIPTSAPTSMPTAGGGGAGGGGAGGGQPGGSRSSHPALPAASDPAASGGSADGVTAVALPPRLPNFGVIAGTIPESSTTSRLAPAAGQQPQVSAGGQHATLAAAPTLLPGADGGAPRGLLIAVAALVVGGLAAGHVRLVQQRLAAITG